MPDYLLLLGGNAGDRRRHLETALKGLSAFGRVLARSRVYETAPVGPSRRAYLNMALRYRTTLSAMGLLIECKRLEARAGRRPGPRWGPRPLDIDLVGGPSSRSRWLTVPHPLAAGRAFVLAPLADVAPRWRPDGRLSVARLLRRLKPGPGIVRVHDDA